MGGWQGMSLDDAFPIRKAIPVGLAPGPASTSRKTTHDFVVVHFIFPSSPTSLTPNPYPPPISLTAQPEPSVRQI